MKTTLTTIFLLTSLALYAQVDMREIEKLKENTQKMRDETKKQRSGELTSETGEYQGIGHVEYYQLLNNFKTYQDKKLSVSHLKNTGCYYDYRRSVYLSKTEKKVISNTNYYYELYIPYLGNEETIKLIYLDYLPSRFGIDSDMSESNKTGVLQKVEIEEDILKSIEEKCQKKIDTDYWVLVNDTNQHRFRYKIAKNSWFDRMWKIDIIRYGLYTVLAIGSLLFIKDFLKK